MILPGLRPRISPETRAARKQPVPVAVSQLKSKRAASAAGFATTGAVRKTLVWSSGQSDPAGPGRFVPSGNLTVKAGVVALFMASLMLGNPQASTNSERMANGNHALAIWPGVYRTPAKERWRIFHSSPMVSVTRVWAATSALAASESRSSGKGQIRLGFQKRRKSMVARSETTPAAMSTRLLSMWLAQNHCVAANEMPTTRMAGVTSHVSDQLTIARTSQKGTITAVMGKNRPIKGLRSLSGSGGAEARAGAGSAMGPQGTRGVLAKRVRAAARE